MAPPIGNQFWKQRSKHGRDKLFASPELMWQAACEYFEWVDANPWKNRDYIPYTLQGLCLYLNCNTTYFRNFKLQVKDDDFNAVINDIEEVVYNHKFTGASIGFFKENIIARDLGLLDRSEINANVTGIRIIRDTNA